jgi:hypothetical protein
MSDTENSRPGLIRAEDPSFGTDRGEFNITPVPRSRGAIINEDECDASYMGVTTYETVPVRESDGRLRRLLLMSVVYLTALVLLGGMVAHIWVAIQTGATSSLDSFTGGLIETFSAMLMLFAGYLLGESKHGGPRRKLKDGEQV